MKRYSAKPRIGLYDVLAGLVVVVAAALVIGGVVFAFTRPPATERATEAVENKGYTVTSAEKDFKFLDPCGKNYTRVVVDAVKDGHDVTLKVCVGIFNVKVRD